MHQQLHKHVIFSIIPVYVQTVLKFNKYIIIYNVRYQGGQRCRGVRVRYAWAVFCCFDAITFKSGTKYTNQISKAPDHLTKFTG